MVKLRNHQVYVSMVEKVHAFYFLLNMPEII